MSINQDINLRGKYKSNYPLKHLNWFKVGGNAEFFFNPEDVDDLAAFLQQNADRIPITVIGAGSNIIVRDLGVKGVVIKLTKRFTEIKLLPSGLLSVGAGCLNFNLAKFAQINSIAGFEFLIGIPGTVGGGVAMNAGSYGSEFKDIINSVHALSKCGQKLIIPVRDIDFSYRHNSLSKDLIFTHVTFNTKIGDLSQIQEEMNKISHTRSETQPISEKTGGSTFANPPNYKAWELIDAVGLRGYKIGDASISKKHCNFMINHGNATASDLESLGDMIIKTVKEQTDIELQWEIKMLGVRNK